jgi:hypothetical protein
MNFAPCRTWQFGLPTAILEATSEFKETLMHLPSRRPAFAILVATLCGLTACRSSDRYHGSEGIVATYRTGTLSAVLPPEVQVPQASAAAEKIFRDRGYTIVEQSGTEDAMKIVARPPRYSSFPRMVTTISNVGSGTRVAFTYEPLPNEEVCRATLEAVLMELGL